MLGMLSVVVPEAVGTVCIEVGMVADVINDVLVTLGAEKCENG
jgi:hypothetical protein